jgi:hypothetical protein
MLTWVVVVFSLSGPGRNLISPAIYERIQLLRNMFHNHFSTIPQ